VVGVVQKQISLQVSSERVRSGCCSNGYW